jgi:hypothetical protein
MAPTLFTGDLEVSLQFSVSLGPYTVDDVRAALNNTVVEDMSEALRLLTIEVLKAQFDTDRLLRGRHLRVVNKANSSAIGQIAETRKFQILVLLKPFKILFLFLFMLNSFYSLPCSNSM